MFAEESLPSSCTACTPSKHNRSRGHSGDHSSENGGRVFGSGSGSEERGSARNRAKEQEQEKGYTFEVNGRDGSSPVIVVEDDDEKEEYAGGNGVCDMSVASMMSLSQSTPIVSAGVDADGAEGSGTYKKNRMNESGISLEDVCLDSSVMVESPDRNIPFVSTSGSVSVSDGISGSIVSKDNVERNASGTRNATSGESSGMTSKGRGNKSRNGGQNQQQSGRGQNRGEGDTGKGARSRGGNSSDDTNSTGVCKKISFGENQEFGAGSSDRDTSDSSNRGDEAGSGEDKKADGSGSGSRSVVVSVGGDAKSPLSSPLKRSRPNW